MKRMFITLATACMLSGAGFAQADWDSSVPYSRKNWNPSHPPEVHNKIDWGSNVPFSRKNWYPGKKTATSDIEDLDTLKWGSDVPYSGKARTATDVEREDD